MKPTIGRIVHYRTYPDGVVYPAIIQRINEVGNLDLWIFGTHATYQQFDVFHGTKLGEWSWPPRDGK